MRLSELRSITVSITAALSLLALTGCPDDPSSEGTEGNTESSTTGDTTAGPTTAPPTTTTDPDTTQGETTETPTTTGSSSESTTGEPLGLLPRVIEAIGGEGALGDLAQVEIASTGNRFVADEGYTPGDDLVDASTFVTTTTLDFENAGIRLDIIRDPLFIPTGMPLMVSEIVDGDLGYVQGLESIFGFPTGNMLSDRWASTGKQQRIFNPHYLLKDLVADPSGATEAGTADFDGDSYELLEVNEIVFPVTLWVDPDTNLIARLTTMENSHLHRDIELDVRYGDWQDTADGVLFPNTLQLYYGGDLVHDEIRSAVTTNPGLPPETFDLPPEATPQFVAAEAERGAANHQHNQLFASAGIPLDGLQTFVQAAEVAPGVWHLTGGSHHTMVVEQASGLVLFDVPLNPQRAEAILDWIDMELGGAPVSHVIVSHHHEDHVAGARVMVATGATLVVHETAETFFDEVMTAPSTIEPDRLENDPVPAVIETIPAGGTYVLDDPMNPITVYELASTHAQDMVLPFVESAGITFTVDIFNPNFGANPLGAQEVLDAFDAAGVTADVNLIFGGHGFGSATVADVIAIAG
jgi:glyoxylase-like metal-dependent hydrolase (beta-lactamase superfamily II)